MSLTIRRDVEVAAEVETSIDLDVSVYCGTCGAHLCKYATVEEGKRGDIVVTVEACPKCLNRAKEEATQ